MPVLKIVPIISQPESVNRREISVVAVMIVLFSMLVNQYLASSIS